MNPRSLLYVPGDRSDMIGKAARCGADAVILDLEDAVAPGSKDAARAAVAVTLSGLALADPGGGPAGTAAAPGYWLRISPGDEGVADLAAAWRPSLTGVIAAKTETLADLELIDRALSTLEADAGVEQGSTPVSALVESARGVLALAELADGPRVARLQLGEVDLASEMGLDAGGAGASVLQTVRTSMILASAAAGLGQPVAPVSVDFHDLGAFRTSCEAFRQMGYGGRSCIHPAQVAVANDVFAPSAAEIAAAHNLVERFDGALAGGKGVAVDVDGTMLDEAVVRRARRLLEGSDDKGATPAGRLVTGLDQHM